MNCLPRSATEAFAASLVRGLRLELFLTPKPGLVDLLDCGSHPDLSLAKMLASIDQMALYLHDLALLLDRGAPLEELVAAGRRAETRSLISLGSNTHRGSIFLTGILLTSYVHAVDTTPASLSRTVAAIAETFFARFPPAATHGGNVRAAYRLGGIVGEAQAGLPALFAVALPAWEEGIRRWDDTHAASYLLLARLMQVVEDTTALHRCGPPGLRRLRRDGAALEAALSGGDDPVPYLLNLNSEYRRLNLTMGGVADLLALAFGVLYHLGWLTLDQPMLEALPE